MVEGLRRSNLIDISWGELHQLLTRSGCGDSGTASREEVKGYLTSRLDQLRQISKPFGKPSDASRKKVQSGAITLADGGVVDIAALDRDIVLALSARFQIDEVQALIVMRSFLYNELPSSKHSLSDTPSVDEWCTHITPYYYAERLHLYRVVVDLFRALQKENMGQKDFVVDLAREFIPQVMPDGPKFVETILRECSRKCEAPIPSSMVEKSELSSTWAKQNVNEQLALLELLLWIMWDDVPSSGPMVLKIFETAYATDFGGSQRNETHLLNEEGRQAREDMTALWILITVEVLQLEELYTQGIDMTAPPTESSLYTSSPDVLSKIHGLIMSHSDRKYVCTYLAWAYVLSRLETATTSLKEVPQRYAMFFLTLSSNALLQKDREPIHKQMVHACLHPDAALLPNLLSMLTNTTVFMTSKAWRTGSALTESNVDAFRAIIKGLVMSMVDMIPVEEIPDFDALVSVWIALFGRSEPRSVVAICKQFWEADFESGVSRRAILDVCRARAPIQFRPLLCLLRALSGAGFLDTDPLSPEDHAYEKSFLSEDRQICAAHVFLYLRDRLSTYTQIIPHTECVGANAIYERKVERYSTPSGMVMGVSYVNLQPIRLPGGSILPARSIGRVLSQDENDFIVVSWQHQHSGWKLILEILTDYVNRNWLHARPNMRKGGGQPLTLGLRDIGMDVAHNDAEIIKDCLDLIRSLIHNNPNLATQVFYEMESGAPVISHTMTEARPPDLVQLTTMILEDALAHSAKQPRHGLPPAELITSAMSVLAALLLVPSHSHRVWLYMRSATTIFGSDRNPGFVVGALAAERMTGKYTMTLALLHLVQSLFHEASSSSPAYARMLPLKEEVLLRAARFVHTEFWVEHLGWKYTRIADRFEIGRRIAAFYVDILMFSPPGVSPRPFESLGNAIIDVLLFKATNSTISPLVTSIAVGRSILAILHKSRRFGDARRLISLLEILLHLSRLILVLKQKTATASTPCLLEQALCNRVARPGHLLDNTEDASAIEPVDVLVTYITDMGVSDTVGLEAVQVLHALCSSLCSLQPSLSTIAGRLNDPEATVKLLVSVVEHPYADPRIRIAVWNFISLAVDKEPVLGRLLVTGQFFTASDWKGKGGTTGSDISKAEPGTQSSKRNTAFEIAKDIVTNWKDMWEINPQLLAAVFRFLDTVWQHGLEHKTILDAIRSETPLWEKIGAAASEPMGDRPAHDATAVGVCLVRVDGEVHCSLHDSVADYCYRMLVQGYAAHIIGSDIGLHVQSQPSGSRTAPPISFSRIEPVFSSREKLTRLISHASKSSYDPALYDKVMERLQRLYPDVTLEQLRSQEPLDMRNPGDFFTFSPVHLRHRLRAAQRVEADEMMDTSGNVDFDVRTINMNLSLAHAESWTITSWQFLLRQAVPYLRGNTVACPVLLDAAVSLSKDIASETRTGDMMATIHGQRLTLLLCLVELVWFSASYRDPELSAFGNLAENLHGIIINEPQTLANSFLGTLTIPFHQVLLQLVYFCAKQGRNIAKVTPKIPTTLRLQLSSLLSASLNMVIDALRILFVAARTKVDVDLDRDMELLVAVFGQCTHPEVSPSSTMWLARCQEAGIIQASLQLFSQTDLTGLSNLALLTALKRPLYVSHILSFHMALASIPAAAEKLASDGLLTAYSNNSISPALNANLIDVDLPELPGLISPVHRTYCAMLSVVSGILSALGRHVHYIDVEATSFLHLCGPQIGRVLSWTVGDSLSFPFVEEMEQVITLFGVIANSIPSTGGSNLGSEKVLQQFIGPALFLLQQLNYALLHPHQLFSLFQPVTPSERLRYEQDASLEISKREVLTQLLSRLLKLLCNIELTLVTISKADLILLLGEQDAMMQQPHVLPHSKVVLGQPATLGTLVDIGGYTLGQLRTLMDQNLSAGSREKSAVSRRIADARRAFETTVMYAVTQLVLCLHRPDFDASSKHDDDPMDVSVRALRGSTSLANRMRRRMKSQVHMDLQALLDKAKPIIARSYEMYGKKSDDIVPIMATFLHEHTPSS
ncbi:hypothetical protein FISHEDRAFT_69977 [Fistulina hepatica ATCC 64428]|uniref:Nucleoporin NUP188 n=1 Tax=Fistulina hepatica ATCC 64428 TaxID=1128425 RepID=A0A0D7ALW0_9AGAR|nr:hypothetical protein FISHEDRAFT_69977 [Fistulina hepatica ATCC 64428]